MDGSGGKGECRSYHEIFRGMELDPEIYDGQEFRITAVLLDGEFDIGISHANTGTPPVEIASAELYDVIVEKVSAETALDRIRAQTTPADWPEIGRFWVEVVDEATVAVEIELREDWVRTSE